MKILVSGASGFIGREFLLKCPRGWDIYTIYHKSDDFLDFLNKNKLSSVTPLSHDLTKHDWFQSILKNCGRSNGGFDVFYHFAATTPFSAVNYTGFEDVKMILNLDELFSTGLIKRFVFPSSYIVYGKAEDHPIKETAPLNPNTLYGANKTVCEKYLRISLGGYKIPYVFLRASCVMGENQTHGFIMKFVEDALNGKEIAIFDRDESRDNVYIDDFVDALITAATRGAGTYNIGYGKSYTIKEIAEMIIKEVGSGSINILDKESKLKNNLLDISKAGAEFGYEPKTEVLHALRKIIKSLKSRNMSRLV
jgi:nucleoside-diphosphate-sugar epimerase